MLVREVMTPDVDLVDPDTVLAKVARLMRDDDLGFVPIGEADRLIGMVTDRDIVLRAVAEGKDVNTTPVVEAMSPYVLYCFDDQTADEAAESMGQNQVRRLPVVNLDKRLIGVVSIGDLAEAIPRENFASALQAICRDR